MPSALQLECRGAAVLEVRRQHARVDQDEAVVEARHDAARLRGRMSGHEPLDAEPVEDRCHLRVAAFLGLGPEREPTEPEGALGFEQGRLADGEQRLELLDELARDVIAGRGARLERRRDALQLRHRGLDGLGQRAERRDDLRLDHHRLGVVPRDDVPRRGAVDVVERGCHVGPDARVHEGGPALCEDDFVRPQPAPVLASAGRARRRTPQSPAGGSPARRRGPARPRPASRGA